MKKYLKYKRTGIEWLGEIPEHWTVKKFGSVSYMKGRIGWQNLRSSEFVNQGPFLITGMNFKDGEINWEEVYHITQERYYEAPEIQLRDHDVLMTKDGTIGKLLYLDRLPGPCSLNSHLLVFRPLNNSYYPKYLYYQLQSQGFLQYVELTKTGTTFYGITQESVSNFKLILPEISEQIIISNYLDYRLGLLNSILAKKQSLITLLKEERTAIINHAVTKGIDPKAKMKPSGVEWIGEIPKHWELKRLKYLGNIKYGLGQPPKQKDGGLPIIRATNVKRGKISEDDLVFVDPDDIPYERDPVLKEDDIIVVRSGAYTADSAIIPAKYDGAITGYDMVVRCVNANSKFIANSLLSEYVLERQLIPESLRAAQPHLNREELGETIIALPPQSEQVEIVEHLMNTMNKIDDSVNKIHLEINLLKEYKTSLINEVVTGKICVLDDVEISQKKNAVLMKD